jgi:hypothetical protein
MKMLSNLRQVSIFLAGFLFSQVVSYGIPLAMAFWPSYGVTAVIVLYNLSYFLARKKTPGIAMDPGL